MRSLLLYKRPLAKVARTGKMPIPLIAIFSCGVGVPPAPEFDEKNFCKRSKEEQSLFQPN